MTATRNVFRTASVALLLMWAVSCDKASSDKSSAEKPAEKPKPTPEQLLTGSWEGSAFVPSSKFAELSGTPMPAGAEVELTGTMSKSFFPGGTFNSESTCTLRIKADNESVALSFSNKSAGTFIVKDGQVYETAEDSVFTPSDEASKKFFDENPKVSADLKTLKGETKTWKIISLTDTTMEAAPSGKFSWNFKKKGN